MINVTIGESKPLEKPFPKLMIRKDENDYSIILAEGIKFGELHGVYISSTYKPNMVGNIFKSITPEVWEDYNEPITIQNA